MPRDIFGNLTKTDIFGRKISKKELKREVLDENRRKGKAAEDAYRMSATLRGVEVERTGKGHDFVERERDLWTGKVKRTKKVEVKSSSTAPLSKLQKKTKKKGNYKVERIEPLFY
jgi:hypothetical protein